MPVKSMSNSGRGEKAFERSREGNLIDVKIPPVARMANFQPAGLFKAS